MESATMNGHVVIQLEMTDWTDALKPDMCVCSTYFRDSLFPMQLKRETGIPFKTLLTCQLDD